MASKCTNVLVRLETEGTLKATWNWSNSHTANYQYIWQYMPKGFNAYFTGNTGDVEYKPGIVTRDSTYSIPSNATKVRFTVKPISKTYTKKVTKTVTQKNKKGKKVKKKVTSNVTMNYFTSDWSAWVVYDVTKEKPATPGEPSRTFNPTKTSLVAALDNIPVGENNSATKISFELYNCTDRILANTLVGTVSPNGRAAVTFDLTRGKKYRIRCRAIDAQGQYSNYTDYYPNDSDTENPYIVSLPSAPDSIKSIRLVDDSNEKRIEMEFDQPDSTVESYKLEYTKNINYFDAAVGGTTTTPLELHQRIIPLTDSQSLGEGNTYYFRLCSVNKTGDSYWTDIVSLTIGSKPETPTTWNLSSTVTVGENAVLYWTHNTVDGSKETEATLLISIDGVEQPEIVVPKPSDSQETISQYTLDTSVYTNGASIDWKVKTKGIYSGTEDDGYSDYSASRNIKVVAVPSLELGVSLEEEGSDIISGEITQYPFYIKAIAGPNTQKVIRWYLSIVANEDSFESVSDEGTVKYVNAGDIVYSKHFDNNQNELSVMILPTDVALENNKSYTINMLAVMDSGLTVEKSRVITMALADDEFAIGCSVSVDEDYMCAYIRPFVHALNDETEQPLSGYYLSVFRINYDGTFTEIESDIDSALDHTVIDLHPSLDNARYRVVGVSQTTGKVVYDDYLEPVEGIEIIIQWNEKKNESFIVNDIEDASDIPPVTGEFLTLPWNIDTSENHSRDIALIEYIGRAHPVGYYGTQLGETATWNTDVDKEDTETIYALRRLAIYQGDVYVREPSGVGYWAQVSVSFNNTHAELVIPVTLTITRVEGGA